MNDEMERMCVTEGRSKPFTKKGNFLQGLKYDETLVNIWSVVRNAGCCN